MRVITNELKIKRGRQYGTIMFFVSLFILTAGLIFTNFISVSSEALMFVPCLVMPLGIITTVTSVRLTNEYVRQPRPETAIADGLSGVNRRSVLFNYFAPANHILITPHGIYTILAKYQMSKFKVTGETWVNFKNRGPLAPIFLYMRQEGLGQPFVEARRAAAAVQLIIDAIPNLSTKVEVQPMVTFTHPRATLEIENPALPVSYVSTKKKPSLKSVIRDDKRDKAQREVEEADKSITTGYELSDEDMVQIETALLKTLKPNEYAGASLEDDD